MDPGIAAIAAHQPVFMFVAIRQDHVAVVGMDGLQPAQIQCLVGVLAGQPTPGGVDVQATPLVVGSTDQGRHLVQSSQIMFAGPQHAGLGVASVAFPLGPKAQKNGRGDGDQADQGGSHHIRRRQLPHHVGPRHADTDDEAPGLGGAEGDDAVGVVDASGAFLDAGFQTGLQMGDAQRRLGQGLADAVRLHGRHRQQDVVAVGERNQPAWFRRQGGFDDIVDQLRLDGGDHDRP